MDNSVPWHKKLHTNYPKLSQDLSVDIAIIGGGIVGITTAYLLTNLGKKVALIERLDYCGGQTGNTTALTTCKFDTATTEIIKNYSVDAARHVWQGSQSAIDFIEKTTKEHSISCNFVRCPAYIYADKTSDQKLLQTEADYAKQFGIDAQFKQDNKYFFAPNGYLEIQNQAKMQPLEYLSGVLSIVEKQGGKIFTKTTALSVTQDQSIMRVKTDTGHILSAKDVVVATFFPFTADALFADKFHAYNSYVIEAEIPKDILPDAIVWNTKEIYEYFRIEKGEEKDHIILGGYDQQTGHDFNYNPYEKLEEYLRNILGIKHYTILDKWNGEWLGTVNKLPLIGRYSDHHYIASGFAGWGIAFGTFSAHLLKDLILGNESEYYETFNPKQHKGISTYISEGITKGVATVKNAISAELESDTENIQPNTGKIARMKGKPVTIYRDKNGRLHKRSAFCTHMGCVVNWNQVANTWDCPCHGSRFDINGAVLTGPATKPLSEISE